MREGCDCICGLNHPGDDELCGVAGIAGVSGIEIELHGDGVGYWDTKHTRVVCYSNNNRAPDSGIHDPDAPTSAGINPQRA